jgi:hypothetical protein
MSRFQVKQLCESSLKVFQSALVEHDLGGSTFFLNIIIQHTIYSGYIAYNNA